MVGLLADYNAEGHLSALLTLCEQPGLAEWWRALDLKAYAFDHFRLDPRTSDAALWRLCQAEQLVLITDNRNEEDAESLQAVIRAENTLASLPVFTRADSARILRDRIYAERVAWRMVESLYDIEVLRGSGRIFLP